LVEKLLVNEIPIQTYNLLTYFSQPLQDLENAIHHFRETYGQIITMCAWTRQIQEKDHWITVEKFLEKRFGIKISHGISSEALKKLNTEAQNQEPTSMNSSTIND
jgi:hypothetical protein